MVPRPEIDAELLAPKECPRNYSQLAWVKKLERPKPKLENYTACYQQESVDSETPLTAKNNNNNNNKHICNVTIFKIIRLIIVYT